MAAHVDEIMNRELFSLNQGDLATHALGYILALDITGAPVVDEGGRPEGVVSLRDLVGSGPRTSVAERMTRPAVTIAARATIDQAARLIGQTGLHRLVVVDATGRAVGMVSAVDVTRALVGLPARHPASFPHYDAQHGVTWTDDTELRYESVEAAPDGPGVLVLSHDAMGERARTVWAESSPSLRGRVLDLLSLPQSHLPTLSQWLERGHIRFRAAAVADPELRQRIAAELLSRSREQWDHRVPQ